MEDQKDIFPEISFDRIPFGTMRDFQIAITELKWFNNKDSELDDDILEYLSIKYNFPPDFLMYGLGGFQYPDDYIISKSEWYPIFYSWMMSEHNEGLILLKKYIEYLKYQRRAVIYCAISGYLPLPLYLIYDTYSNLTTNNIILNIIAILLPFYIPLLMELQSRIQTKKEHYEEYFMMVEKEGMNKAIESHNNYIMTNTWRLSIAGDILIKKLEEAPFMQFIYMGENIVEKEIKYSYFQKIKLKMGLIPERLYEKEKIPIFYAENIIQSYIDRLKQLKIS